MIWDKIQTYPKSKSVTEALSNVIQLLTLILTLQKKK